MHPEDHSLTSVHRPMTITILCLFPDCLPRPEPLPDADHQPQTGAPLQAYRGELSFSILVDLGGSRASSATQSALTSHARCRSLGGPIVLLFFMMFAYVCHGYVPVQYMYSVHVADLTFAVEWGNFIPWEISLLALPRIFVLSSSEIPNFSKICQLA